MSDIFEIKKIATIKNGFSTKFGIPRQSGLCSNVKSKIIFEPQYAVPEAFRDLDGFSHIWLIWQFSQAVREDWSPTVRPPRLGGNKRTGVFATRSPFRPNALGLSCVKLDKIEIDPKLGPVLHISGADLMDGTPIYDIKPYIPYADCKPYATNGFLGANPKHTLDVTFNEDITNNFDKEFLDCIKDIVGQDPRPAYQNDPHREYKMNYGGYEIVFNVLESQAFITKIYKEKI
jgi:tRNA-Thr(GGU) m(6)t(6)A37 methyltransferase TsaA